MLLQLESGEETIIGGFTTKAEMEYQLRRRYRNTPGIRFVSTFLHTRHLENYEIKVLEGQATMTQTATTPTYTSFAELETNYWKDNPKAIEWPWDDSGVREALIAYGVPFTISEAGERESAFKDREGNPQVRFWFHITCDTNSEGYQYAYKKAQLLPKYELTLEAGGAMIGKRRAQLALVQSQIAALGGCYAMLVKGGKTGKEVMFAAVEN